MPEHVHDNSNAGNSPTTTGRILRERLEAMERKNPRFSLRAMARQLGASPSYISELIHEKKTISPTRAIEFADRLSMSTDETAYFCALAQFETTDNPKAKATLWGQLNDMRPGAAERHYEVDQFRVLSEWYHIPILELTEVDGFDFSAINVARRLGISAAESVGAIARLRETGLLTTDAKSGRTVKTKSDGRFESSHRNEALRSFHCQMLDKAKEAIADQEPDERLVGSETLAFDPRDLPKVEAILRQAFGAISRLNKGARRKSDVFHLSAQFFRVTRSK